MRLTEAQLNAAQDRIKALGATVRTNQCLDSRKPPKQPTGGYSELAEALYRQILGSKLTEPEREMRFHAARKWRFDFAWPSQRVAVEVEGAVWTQGRHTRGQGVINDMEKYNNAALLGWRVLRFAGNTIKNGQALEMLKSPLLGLKR